MGDPLSVAASITGLIAVAGQLYVALDGFISNVRDAPSLARTIQAEIKSFRNSLNALHRLLEDPGFRRGKRAALISADYVVVSFTDAVLVFSKLETYVLPLTKFTDFGLGARTRWTRKKRKLNELVGRLQWQKHTLTLQLNILQWSVLIAFWGFPPITSFTLQYSGLGDCWQTNDNAVHQTSKPGGAGKSWIL